MKKFRTGRKSNRKAQDRRRQSATERQEAYNKLSTNEKVNRLDRGKFVAKKQRAKLTKEA